MQTRIASRRFFAAAASLALLTAATLPALAQRVGGLIRTTDTVLYKTVDVYKIAFYGGERARVGAVGDGDIDIYVYDNNGILVATDHDSDSTPIVEWTPSRTSTYTVRIRNEASYDVDYTLIAN